NPAARQTKSTRPAAAYPRRLPKRGNLVRSGAACRASARNKSASHAAIHSGKPGIRNFGRGSVNGPNCESAVASVPVQVTVVGVPAEGVHVAAVPRLFEPFLNWTVPVGTAPLLVLEISAVSTTFPPDTMLVTLLLTVAMVVALLTV